MEKAKKQAIAQKIMKLRMPFIANEGQTAEDVSFYAKTFGGTAYVTQKGEMVYSFSKIDPKDKTSDRASTPKNIKGVTLKETLVGASVTSPKGEDRSQTKVNYFIGNDKSKWKTNIPTYDSVSLGEVYRGIDLSLKAYGKTVEKVFSVQPGADPKTIKLKIEQANSFKINDKGELEIETDLGAIQFSKPIAYQEKNGKRETIKVAYLLNGDTYGFKVDDYDTSFPLIIDPVLSWNTFMGSSTYNDRSNSIALDSDGNVYVAGSSQITWGSPINPHASGDDGFVAKLDSSGNLVWNTFMGSNSSDIILSIAVDGSGNVYVAGTSFATWGSPVNAFSGFEDGFAAKLDSSGGLVWNTFMGSPSQDDGNSIAVDSVGNVYVAGDSYATWGSPIHSFTDGAGNGFAAKLNSSGGLVWHTFMGSGYTNTTIGKSIAVDSSGNVYVAGESMAPWGSPVSPFGQVGYKDGFAEKLDSSGTLLWNTFMGGSDEDSAASIAVDGSGNVYVAGLDVGLDPDGFATKLDSSGGQLWYTTLGAYPDGDTITSISIDGAGNVYVAGYSEATWGSPSYPHSGGIDAFAAKLSNSGVLVWNTFLGGGGGSSDSRGFSLAVEGSGNVYVAGYSNTSWGTPVNPFAGVTDAFVAKLSQPVWYVTPLGAGLMDGTSWGNAFGSIQDAIDAASAGDEIWVAEGTYVPGTAQSESFQLKTGVALYGGFAGTEIFRDERDWKTNVTTLSGDIGTLGDNSDNAWHVVYGTSCDDATLDGFTVTDGNANSSAPGPDKSGAGVYSDSTLTISNCVFTGNHSDFRGAAIFNYNNSYSTISNCTFTGNTAGSYGGAILITDDSSPTIINCEFSNNTADMEGGAISIDANTIPSTCSPVITNCTFSENSAVSAGGAISNWGAGATPTITNCVLWGDTAGSGPEIYDYSGAASDVNYSNVEGGWTGGTGNINSDPLFMDPANGDFHLTYSSLCIDSGDNSAAGIPIFDFEGEPRIVDTAVDMGADEYFDGDADGMPDWWENENGLRSDDDSDASQDDDNDGLSNFEEYQHNTDPNNEDTDGDGLSDGNEVNIYGTDPLTPIEPNHVLIDNTSQPIHKSGCERVGSSVFRFVEGSDLNAGDWWYIDLPNDVTICRPIDYLIVGDTAGTVDITGGAQATTFTGATAIPAMAPDTILGPLSVQTIAGSPTSTIVGGSIAIRVTANEGDRRILVELYGANAGSSITVGQDTTFNIRILDGQLYTNNILLDSDSDGIYGNDGSADLLPGPEPDVNNTICTDASEMAGTVMNYAFGSYSNKFTLLGSPWELAHVIAPVTLEGCTGATSGNLLIDGTDCSIDYETAVGYVPTSTFATQPRPGGGTGGNLILIQGDFNPGDQYGVTVSIETDVGGSTTGVYFTDSPALSAFGTTGEACTDPSAGTSINTVWTAVNDNDQISGVAFPAPGTCSVPDILNRIKEVRGEWFQLSGSAGAILVDLPPLCYDTSVIGEGTQVTVRVSLEKYPCGEIFNESRIIGTFSSTDDTDSDGLTDINEINIHGTDPFNPDTDGDGLSDGDEVNTYSIDPLDEDTDGDTINDGVEVAAGTNPDDINDKPAFRVDDFYGDTIDGTKWTNLEFIRRIIDDGTGKVLQSAITQYGSSNNNNLYFSDPETIHSFQADVTVKEYNNINADVRARIYGRFYNTKYGPGDPGNGADGEIYAQVGIRDTGSGLKGYYNVFQCNDANCIDDPILTSGDFSDVNLNEKHTVSIDWDGSQFTFVFDGTPVTYNPTTDAPIADPNPKNHTKSIATRVDYRGGDPDEGGSIFATFDNVRANGAAYDDFETPSGMIDPLKWWSFEFVRVVDSHMFESAITQYNNTASNHLTFIYPQTITAYQADITVAEAINNGAVPYARLAGIFYNDGTPGLGDTGDIFVQVGLRYDGTNLVPYYDISRCGEDCNYQWEELGLYYEGDPVEIGQSYRFSMAWDENSKQFNFGMDGITRSVDMTTPLIEDATGPFKAIGTRVRGPGAPGDWGYINAKFDNVVVLNEWDSNDDGTPDSEADWDGDGYVDAVDNCPFIANDQANLDNDGWGDACDDTDGDGLNDWEETPNGGICTDDPINNPNKPPCCPFDPNNDADGDGVCANAFEICDLVTVPCEQGDLCPDTADGATVDENGCSSTQVPPTGGWGDKPCKEDCPVVVVDDDHDGKPDAEEPAGCVGNPDCDGDGVKDGADNCITVDNGPLAGTCVEGNVGNPCINDSECGSGGLCSMDQKNSDTDLLGDACDPDDDNDGYADAQDNCRIMVNDQVDFDCDGIGDICDDDKDGDGLTLVQETELGTDPSNPDSDTDGYPDGPYPYNYACVPDTSGVDWGLGQDPHPTGEPQWTIAFEVHNGSGDNIIGTWLPKPSQAEYENVTSLPTPDYIEGAVLPAVPVEMSQVTIVATLIDPDGNQTDFINPVTFTIDPEGSSRKPGVAINDGSETCSGDCSNDFSFDPYDRDALNLPVPEAAGAPEALAPLYAFDFGGWVTIQAKTTLGDGTEVKGTRKFPLDTDGDDLPDVWEEYLAIAGFDKLNKNSFGQDLNDGYEDIDESLNNVNDGDDINNYMEYRGIILDDAGGTVVTHQRLNPMMKDLFIRGDNFANSIPPNLDVLNFSVHVDGGSAFEEAHIAVHDVTGRLLFSQAEEPPNLDILVVKNVTDTTKNELRDDDGFINHYASRSWSWDYKGASYSGRVNVYSYDPELDKKGTFLYYLNLMNYVYNRPYKDEVIDEEYPGWDTYQAPLNEDYIDLLDPVDKVEDYYLENGYGPEAIRGKKENQFRTDQSTVLDGDHMIAGWTAKIYGSKPYEAGYDFSVFDADGDGRVEWPAVTDALNIGVEYDPA